MSAGSRSIAHTEKHPKTHVTLTSDLKIQQGFRGCRCTRSYKISSSWVQRFISYRVHKFFALSRNGEKSDNPVPWSWPLTYDIEILLVFMRLSRNMFVLKFIELSPAVHELSCQQKRLRRKQHGPSLPRGESKHSVIPLAQTSSSQKFM